MITVTEAAVRSAPTTEVSRLHLSEPFRGLRVKLIDSMPELGGQEEAVQIGQGSAARPR